MTQIAAEKNLDEDIIIDAVKQAIAAAYRKDFGNKDQEVEVVLRDDAQFATILQVKEVVEEVENENFEISLAEAKKIKKGALLSKWPRRAGKSTVLRGHIKPHFKKERKMKTQLLNGLKIKQGKIIRSTTQVILIDDWTDRLVKLIQKKRPDVMIVGLSSGGEGIDVSKSEIKEECKKLAFE